MAKILNCILSIFYLNKNSMEIKYSDHLLRDYAYMNVMFWMLGYVCFNQNISAWRLVNPTNQLASLRPTYYIYKWE